MMSSIELLDWRAAELPDDRQWQQGGVLSRLVAAVTITIACVGLMLVGFGG